MTSCIPRNTQHRVSCLDITMEDVRDFDNQDQDFEQAFAEALDKVLTDESAMTEV